MAEDRKEENISGEQPVLNKNTFSWLWKFTEGKRVAFLVSVILALLGVVCLLLVYICLADIIRTLVTGNSNMDFYVQRGIQIAVLWILRYICHGLSTSTSHGATFGLIGNARKQLLKKLNTMPLGAVQTRSSGEYKNTICDRADQIETIHAEILP